MTTVNLTEFFPWTFLLHLIRALITFNVVHSTLKNKYNTIITFCAIVASGMTYSYISMFISSRNNELIIMMGYYLMMFLILLITNKGNIFSKLFASIFSLIVYLISTLAFSIIINIISNQSISFGINYEISLTLFLLDVLFTYSFHYIFILLIKIIKSKTNKSFSYKIKYLFFFLFPITHIFNVMQTFSSLINIKTTRYDNFIPNNYQESISVLFTVLCLLLDFSIIFIIDHFEKIEDDNIIKERELLKNTMDYHQMLMMKQEKQEFRKIKHDFANIITTAKGFIEINKPEKALSILSNTNEDLMGLAGFSVCSNETINTVLYIKMQQAEKNNIDLNIEIEENAVSLIDDYDLCRLLHNLIDNALNAVIELNADRSCKILIEIDDEQICISSENKYKENTKRKKSPEHGNGIGIVKEIASKYGGKYSCKQLDDVWYTETFLANKKPANSTPPPNFGLAN